MTVYPPSVVVYVNGSPHDQYSGHGPEQSVGQFSTARQPYDPYKVHRQFPERWKAYIRANYRNISHITRVFQVSEKTARNWWAGDTGAVGGHVAVAVQEHPDVAPQMLFAAE